MICPCDTEDVIRFTSRLGYLRHVLRSVDIPVGELLAAHLQQAGMEHGSDCQPWREKAAQELIIQLRDDYPTLMSVLSAVGEVL
jgi:hypothetical protein